MCYVYNSLSHSVPPVQGYELLHSLHTPDGVPMDEDVKHVHFHDFSDVSLHLHVATCM